MLCECYVNETTIRRRINIIEILLGEMKNGKNTSNCATNNLQFN